MTDSSSLKINVSDNNENKNDNHDTKQQKKQTKTKPHTGLRNRLTSCTLRGCGLLIVAFLVLLFSDNELFRNLPNPVTQLKTTTISQPHPAPVTQQPKITPVTDTKYGQHQNQNQNNQFKLIFFIGLEGVGHHLLFELFQYSPHVNALQNNQYEILPVKLHKLYDALYHINNKTDALWSSYCTSTGPSKDPNIQFDDLVQLLQQIKNESITVANAANQTTITMPLNTVDEYDYVFGMMSYPNFKWGNPCRGITFPNLDFLYDACVAAKVDCYQIYLYRDPMSVISSTSIKRHFNPTIIQAIQLYITQLHVIHAQLSRYPEKTISCHDFYDATLSHEVVFGPIRDLFGWTNATDFKNDLAKMYRPPKYMTEEERIALVPNEYHVFMDSYRRMHNKVVNLCRQQQETNKLSTEFQLPKSAPLPVQNNDESRQYRNNSPIKIVMTIGLYGSGHDILAPIIQEHHQSSLQSMDNSELINQLQHALYRRYEPEKSLLSMYCVIHRDAIFNVEENYQKVVNIMQSLKSSISINQDQNYQEESVVIPLNLLKTKNNDNKYLSYPNSLFEMEMTCQQLDYLNLDVFYKVCDDVGIDCEHVYIYRDPNVLMHEISKILNDMPEAKNYYVFNADAPQPTLFYYMHLYLSFLYVIRGQLLNHPNRLSKCLDMDNTNNDSKFELWNVIRSLYGLKDGLDDETMSKAMDEIMRSGEPRMTEFERKGLIPEKYKMYMKSLEVANEEVLELCN